MATREEYVEKMKSQLDAMNDQLDTLAEQSKNAKNELQSKYKQQMADLRAESSKANAKLAELKDAGDDAWENLVADMEKTRNAFKHSYNYFKAQF